MGSFQEQFIQIYYWQSPVLSYTICPGSCRIASRFLDAHRSQFLGHLLLQAHKPHKKNGYAFDTVIAYFFVIELVIYMWVQRRS